MAKQLTKQQHFVPDSYMDCFLADKKKGTKLYQYTRKDLMADNFTNVIPGTPKNLLKEGWFYEIGKTKTNLIENMLSEIEGNYINVFRNKIQKSEPLTEEEQASLDIFLSTLEHRTPATLANVNKFFDDVIEMGRSLEDQYGKNHKQSDEWENLKNSKIPFIQRMATAIELNTAGFSDYAVLKIPDIFKDSFFITSEHPITRYDFVYPINGFYGINPQSPSMEMTIPLSDKICLFGNNIGITGYYEIPFQYIEEVNYRTLFLSPDRIISPKELNSDFTGRMKTHCMLSFLLYFNNEKIFEEAKQNQ